MAASNRVLGRSLTALGVVTVGLVFLAPPSGALSGAVDARHVVSVHVSGNKAVFGVASSHPGWTHVRNTRAAPLAVLRGTGQGASTLAADFNHQNFSATERRFPYATTVDPNADAYIRLRPGRYFVIDAMHNGTWTASQIGVLRVSGRTVNAALPRANSITFDKHNNIYAAATLQRLPYARLIDRSSHYVDIEAIPIDASTSKATVQRFLAHPSLKKIKTLTAHPIDTLAQTSAPNATIYNPEHLRKGREMLISFRNLDDKLHQGQARLVTVR